MKYMMEYKLDGGKPHRDIWDVDLAIVHMTNYKKGATEEQQEAIDFIIRGLMYSYYAFGTGFNIKFITEAIIRHRLNKIENYLNENALFVCDEIREHLRYYIQGLEWSLNLIDGVVITANTPFINKKTLLNMPIQRIHDH